MKNKDYIKQHRGEYLDKVVRTSGLTITAVTAKVGVSRSTFYNHSKTHDLKYADIEKYGKVLNHNFSDAYPKDELPGHQEPVIITTFEEMKKDRDHYKSKYEEMRAQLKVLLSKHE